MKRLALSAIVLVACDLPPAPAAAPVAPPATNLHVLDLGTCPLESGAVIEDCKIAYRTYGTLDASRSNAVLFPTWFTGTTASLVDGVPDKLVDTNRYFLILVDALGDGVSSSPSNSARQPRLKFPKFTIGDMVESQRRLVDHLGIAKLHAVMGISMGGMQALTWAVKQPERMSNVISIVGTPQLTSQDLLLWTAELHAIESDVAYQHGDYEGRPALKTVLDIHQLGLVTPVWRAHETSREDFPRWAATIESDTKFDWNDWHRQLEAMLAHDLARGTTIEAVARRVKARTMVVVATQDLVVNPMPARAFAHAMGAEVVELEGPCGHLSPGCEQEKLAENVKRFLASP